MCHHPKRSSGGCRLPPQPRCCTPGVSELSSPWAGRGCSIVPKAELSPAPPSHGSATPVSSCSLSSCDAPPRNPPLAPEPGWFRWALPRIIWHLQAPGAGCWVISGCQSCCWVLSWGFPPGDAPGAAEPWFVGINHQTQHSPCQGSPGCKLLGENPKSEQ